MELQFDEDSHGISLIKLEPNFGEFVTISLGFNSLFNFYPFLLFGLVSKEESLDAEVNDISDDKVLNEGTEYESVVVKENGQEEGKKVG